MPTRLCSERTVWFWPSLEESVTCLCIQTRTTLSRACHLQRQVRRGHPQSREPYLLVFNEGLWMGDKMEHTLVNPNQMRLFGITVQDNPVVSLRCILQRRMVILYYLYR